MYLFIYLLKIRARPQVIIIQFSKLYNNLNWLGSNIVNKIGMSR